MSIQIIYAFLAVFCGAGLRVLFGWLKAGGKFKPEKLLRTMLIAFAAALIMVGQEFMAMDPMELFFSVLTMTYAVDDVKNATSKPQVFDYQE